MNTDQPNEVALVSAALVAAQGQVKAAEFDAQNPFFKSKYATLGSVIEASRKALHDNGLAILQTPLIADHLVTLKTTIIHQSGQSLDGGTMSLPLGESERNSDAQMAGSIITYLRRYSWSSILGIYADQDQDGNEAPKGAVRRAVEVAKAAPATPAPAAGPSIGPKYRLQTLNKLKAAPGGENRNLFVDFAVSKGWIKVGQEPEDWPFSAIPATPEAFFALGEEIQAFERTMREGVAP